MDYPDGRFGVHHYGVAIIASEGESERGKTKKRQSLSRRTSRETDSSYHERKGGEAIRPQP
jgi:hypothetical protein